MENLLLLLAVLACPLTMWFMMRSMRGHRDESGVETNEDSRMRERLAILEEENARLRAREVLSDESGHTSQH